MTNVAIVVGTRLLLDVGAVLQIDDGQQGQPLRFSTCMPGGCFVALTFDANSIAALRVEVQSTDSKELALSISLKGFSAAFDRLLVLGKT